MNQEVVSTKKSNVKDAVEDLVRQLKNTPSSYKAVIFMAAINYDFEKLSVAVKQKFPKSEVIGVSTAGEIDRNGFQDNSIVLTTMSDDQTHVKGVLIENGSKYPMANKDDIESALTSVGITCGNSSSHLGAFAITFINGVYNAEETILANFYSIIRNDKFPLAGGTAGYTGNEPKTFVSYNGKTTQDGAVMLFVKTTRSFDIRQEIIFSPTGKTVYATNADPVKRTIYQLNGRPAQMVYAEMLNVPESKAASMTFENPFGRYLDGTIHIAALAGFDSNRACTLFARVVPNTSLEMMHIVDPLEKCDETCRGIKSVIPNPKFTLLMTCITRTAAFANMGISGKIIEKYKQTFPTFAGFSCYGEQHGKVHCNQTLVTVTIGD